MSFADFSFRLH